jgi:hypothetical protein
MNDEIVARLQPQNQPAVLRVGLPNDYAVAFLQKALAPITRSNIRTCRFPFIATPVSAADPPCSRTTNWIIAVAMFDGTPPPGLIYTWAERPIWVAAGDYRFPM